LNPAEDMLVITGNFIPYSQKLLIFFLDPLTGGMKKYSRYKYTEYGELIVTSSSILFAGTNRLYITGENLEHSNEWWAD